MKIAFFDWDSTLADPNKFPHSFHGLPLELLLTFKKLNEKDYLTTINTARDALEIKDAIGKYKEQIISKDMIISIEFGSRLGTLSDDNNKPFLEKFIFHFDDIELNLIYQMIINNKVIAKFFTSYPQQEQVIWVNNNTPLEDIKKQFTLSHKFICGDIIELKKLLFEGKLILMTIYGSVKEVSSKLNYITYNIDLKEISHQNISKQTAIIQIAKNYNVDLKDCIIAGDSTPDIPMLEIQECKHRIVVSDKNIEVGIDVERVEDSIALSKYINNLLS